MSTAVLSTCDENTTEREMFDADVVHAGGDVRMHIAQSLRIWASVRPGGSYADQCKIMSNEVLRLHLPAPVPSQGPSDDEMMGWARDAGMGTLKDTEDPRFAFVKALIARAMERQREMNES